MPVRPLFIISVNTKRITITFVPGKMFTVNLNCPLSSSLLIFNSNKIRIENFVEFLKKNVSLLYKKAKRTYNTSLVEPSSRGDRLGSFIS